MGYFERILKERLSLHKKEEKLLKSIQKKESKLLVEYQTLKREWTQKRIIAVELSETIKMRSDRQLKSPVEREKRSSTKKEVSKINSKVMKLSNRLEKIREEIKQQKIKLNEIVVLIALAKRDTIIYGE